MNQFTRIAEHIGRLSTPRAVCVGDVMLDRYVYGEVKRISPEAPVGVLEIGSEREMLGGAGNVVRNLRSLGAQVTFLSVVGDDIEGEIVEESLQEDSGCTAILVREQKRSTSVKRRYVAHGQQLLRVDRESRFPIAPKTLERLLTEFERALAVCDVVVLSDYAKGVLSGQSAQRFIDIARASGTPVLVDPKGRDFRRYSRATILKPNLSELSAASAMHTENDAEIMAAARKIIQDTSVTWVVVTRGAMGMTAISEDGPIHHFPAAAKEVFDVSGAGDTVAATVACALGAGVALPDALYLANLAAGLVVAKTGTAVIECEELLQEVKSRFASQDHQTGGGESSENREQVASNRLLALQQALSH